MYKQPNASYTSTDSLRRLSSNNPFRQFEQPQHSNRSQNSVSSLGNNPHFSEWVQRNRQIVDSSSEDELEVPSGNGFHSEGVYNSGGNSISGSYTPTPVNLPKPAFPVRPSRTGSDSSVNYYPRKMSSNNPFASALNEGKDYVHHRDPPPLPRSSKGIPPPRPPKTDIPELPTYEEAAGVERARGEYPQEKQESPSHRHSSRPHRSQSDSNKYRSHRDRRERGESHRSSKDRRRHRSSKEKSDKKKPQPVKAKNMDTIDKLDVTGFFGGGFHHDGPFDACTPHRNKNSKAAPVMAFPVDGPNNSIKGMPSNNKNEHMKLAFGNYDEDQNEIVGQRVSGKNIPEEEPLPVIKTNKTSNDVSASLFIPKQDPSVINFDVNAKATPIHGSTTAGLGSSTFVDGAPAPKSTINDEYLSVSNGGLSRKKSLVQRLRKNSSSDAGSNRTSSEAAHNTRIEGARSPSFGLDSDGEYGSSHNGTGSSLLQRVKSLKVRK